MRAQVWQGFPSQAGAAVELAAIVARRREQEARKEQARRVREEQHRLVLLYGERVMWR